MLVQGPHLQVLRELPSEQEVKTKDYHRNVHARNQLEVLEEIKKEKIRLEDELIERRIHEIQLQRRNEAKAVERYRLLNIL